MDEEGNVLGSGAISDDVAAGKTKDITIDNLTSYLSPLTSDKEAFIYFCAKQREKTAWAEAGYVVAEEKLPVKTATKPMKNLDFAIVLAFEWIASTDDLHQIGGYHVISRRLTDGMVPDDRGICEIIDQAVSAMSDKNLAVRHAAYNCLNRLALLGEDYASIVDSALEKCGLSQKQ